MKEQIKKLTTILSMAGLNGNIALASASGFFRTENIPLIVLIFIAGPGAILVSIFLDGTTRERIIIALISGLIATLIIMFAASIGPKFLEFLNINIIKLAGGISILLIGLIVMGIKIPEKFSIHLVLQS
jgi:small neutral amino acid transporter SnatA (MarC family)